MTVTVVDLSGEEKVRIKDAGDCQAVVFRDDYTRCANRAAWKKGQLKLCVPHSRLDEVEVVT